MFDIGFQELLMVSVLALLIMGPERLPGAIRTGSLWLNKIRRSFAEMKHEIEQEIGIDAEQINLDLHNQQVLKSLEENKQRLKDEVSALQPELDELQQGVRDFADYAASEATPPPSSKAGQQLAQAKEAGIQAQAQANASNEAADSPSSNPNQPASHSNEQDK